MIHTVHISKKIHQELQDHLSIHTVPHLGGFVLWGPFVTGPKFVQKLVILAWLNSILVSKIVKQFIYFTNLENQFILTLQKPHKKKK